MKGSPFSISQGLKCFFPILCLMLPILYYGSGFAQSDSEAKDLILLVEPPENEQVVAKKPKIKCAIKPPFGSAKLLVILDGTDISGVLNITPEGFEYKPVGVLASGSHSLSVTAYTPDGRELKREFTFSTRHSKPFEEAYSSNELSTVVEKKVIRAGDVTHEPSYKIESNLGSEAKLKEKEWQFSFNTNIRYFNQNLPVTPPTEKGFSLANYLFQGKYTSKRFSFLGEAGDVTIDETPNTVQGLARRGGNFVFQSNDLHLQLRAFDVKSEQLIGFNGGMGFGTTPADHITGVSGDLGLISDKLRFRTIYVRGGEEGSSFGISTTGGRKEGDVLGLLLTTDFFKQKLMTETELDFSRFDADTSDEVRADRDKAYRLKVGGTLGKYTYEALYEYMGPDYEVIGNPGLQKNREGFTLRTGANYQIHIINLSLSRYNDNVNKDHLYPKTYSYQGTIDYTFNKFQSLPMGLSYQKSMLDSTMEPALTTPIKTDTDAISGRINYIKGKWNLGFQTSYSFQNDRTDQDNDMTTVTYTFTPTYNLEYLSIFPSFSFNRSRSNLTEIHTDTYTSGLDLRGDIFRKRVTYGVGGTLSLIRASDNTTRQDILSSNFNVSYLLFKNLWGFLNPSVGIRGLYNRTNDRVLDHTTNECAIFLVIQTTMPFSF